VMSVMIDIKTFLICGSTNGLGSEGLSDFIFRDLHLVKQSCLYYDKEFLTESAKKQKCLAKTYTAHVSFVN
jgi:hypothetical protein